MNSEKYLVLFYGSIMKYSGYLYIESANIVTVNKGKRSVIFKANFIARLIDTLCEKTKSKQNLFSGRTSSSSREQTDIVSSVRVGIF
jgi:hypothetical protein